MVRTRIGTGTPWEDRVGYSRAVRAGVHVFVSGTCAIESDGTIVAPGDAREQTRFILRRIAAALADCGSSIDDVVRTRMYVTHMEDAAAVGEVHAEFFHVVRPASTMVKVAGLVNPGLVVEIEADAIILAVPEVDA
jgi:enamine deaminase RidA (YjgF/YER057c/UK114 family)